MRRRIKDSAIGKQCPICLNRVEIKSAAILIPCEHAYCIRCIRRWSDIKRNCPLCTANFTSWLSTINNRVEKLLPLSRGKTVIPVHRDEVVAEALRRRRAQFLEQKRLIRRSREASSVQAHQTRVLPRQRSFGVPSCESPAVIADRITQWRVSIYERRLQAVPLPPKNGLVQKFVGNNVPREMILRRIEPWIQRELRAVLGDPDPTIIVHVATSLFISTYEKMHENFLGQISGEDDFLAPLRPFIHDQTELFWHELRCFAESSFSMETYDTVVEYKGIDQEHEVSMQNGKR